MTGEREIEIVCDFCHKPLTELGGLLFSPPTENSMCLKQHACTDCYGDLAMMESLRAALAAKDAEIAKQAAEIESLNLENKENYLRWEEHKRHYKNEKADLLTELMVAETKFEEQIEQLQATMKDRIEQAHMAGQHDAGVDPSYSNAQAYYLETINHPEAE